MKTSLMLFTIVLAIAFCACRRKPVPLTNEELLVNKSWRLKGLKVVVGVNETDAFANLKPCEKDNRTIFSKSGEYVVDEARTKCNLSDAQQYDLGEWWLNRSQTQLIVKSSKGGTMLYDKIDISDDHLILSHPVVVMGMDAVEYYVFD